MENNISSNRIGILDSFRAIAAISVLLVHWDEKDFPYGHYGVQFFFIISGFVIFKTILQVKTGRLFLIKRFMRLYPAFWFCMLLSTLFINVFSSYSGTHISMRVIFFNATMLQELFHVPSIEDVYWSLVPELCFYLFIFFIFKAKLLHHIESIGFAWILLIATNMYYHLDATYAWVKIFNIRHGQLFLSGILFYRIYCGIDTIKTHILLLACFLISLIIYPLFYPLKYFYISHCIIMAVMYSLFYLFVNNKLKLLSNRVLSFIGLISYPLYLIHKSAGNILIGIFDNYYNCPILSISFTFIIIVFLSYLIHKYIEIPVQIISKKILKMDRIQEI